MISIIIPTLNEQNVIAATIVALKSKLNYPCEIIISDGGSTDETVQAARQHADRVIVHQQSERQTISGGRNAGAKASRGEFLVFFDADCVIPDPNNFFARALRQFERDNELVGLTGYLRVFPENETMADRFVGWILNFGARIGNNLFHTGDAPGGEFQMVRADAFWKIGGYRENLVTCEDRDLFRRLARIGRTKTDAELVVYHTGRRPHAVGWPYLIGLFVVNTVAFRIRGRPLSKEWTPVR
jgi:glycosyltransferase involved in cell wall biosynthesis